MKLEFNAGTETMSIQDTVEKKPRKRTLTESSSFEETEPSKAPKDVLGLGKHLVRELGLADGVNTLAKWMSHHVAELIVKAESADTVEARAKAAAEATATILKIWEQRKELPYEAYPLAPYEELFRLVRKLAPDANPYRFSWQSDITQADRLSAIAFDNFIRLVLTLMFLKLDSLKQSRDPSQTVLDALDTDERYVLATIEEWFALLPQDTTKGPKKNKRKKAEELDLSENALQLITNLRSVLDQLEVELKVEKPTADS